jgi:hypothetical protein
MKVVWLSGFAGSGKDTVAAILCKKLDYYRVAFADMLKDYVAEKYGLNRLLCDTVEGKNTKTPLGKTVRELLIEESAEAKKTTLNIFAEQVFRKIIDSGQELIVISDWRYPHEYEFITKMLGPTVDHTTIRIVRTGLPSLSDPSEHALDGWPFDCTLTNSKLRSLEMDVVTYLKNQ